MTCELCQAARLTTWYHEDDVCWVAECEACFVPMVVWREHGIDPPDDVRAHMLARLGEVAGRLGLQHSIDEVLRSIPDHWHAHARRRWRL